MKIKRHHPGSLKATASGISGGFGDAKTNSYEYNLKQNILSRLKV